MKKVLAAVLLVAGIAVVSAVAAAEPAPKIALEFGGADPVSRISAGMKAIKLDGGFLTGTISASDPNFGFDFTKLKDSTEDTGAFSIRMKVDATNGKAFPTLKLYFSTSDSPALSEDKTVYINDIICDGDWHEYTAAMDSNALWTGDLKSLRVDFEYINDASFAGTVVSLDWLHLDF